MTGDTGILQRTLCAIIAVHLGLTIYVKQLWSRADCFLLDLCSLLISLCLLMSGEKLSDDENQGTVEVTTKHYMQVRVVEVVLTAHAQPVVI
jgi:hypothetical protein